MSALLKVAVLGAEGCGKSALIQQFIKGEFSTDYKPTVDELYVHLVKVPGK